MKKVNITGCMVFDIVCLIQSLENEYYQEYEKYMLDDQKSLLSKIKTLLNDIGFSDYDEHISMLGSGAKNRFTSINKKNMV